MAQRFSRQVIERDTTVREEAPSELEGNTSADDEIENLVAIPIYLADRFSGVVVCANNPEGFGSYDDQVLLSVGDHAGAVLQNSLLHGELRSAYVATVRMLAETIEAKDPFLRGHSEEVSDYVAAVSAELSLDPARREELLFGSLLHDVGKIGISERILLKPGPLTPEERTICELHPRIGYRLVQQVPALAAIAPAILHHHERFDGDGYPSGLRGEQIPLEARVVSVADSFAAMTADRPYKSRMSVEDACTELERCAGSQFDPEVVRIFVQAVRTRPSRGAVSATAEAFDDPELALRREGDEPVLGSGSFAITDNLTLLYSHRYLHEVAEAEAQRAEIQTRPFSVVMLEMAEIDSVNSREGYAAGDEAIKAVARTVQAVALRAAGTGARYGGRRLALLASSVDRDGAARLAREIEAEAAGGPAVRITTATWSPGDSGADILARARAALVSPGAGARVPGASEPFSPPA